MAHPLVEQLVALFLREGYLPQREGEAINRARIAGEWAMGQWVLLTGKDDRLWGWMSWYRVERDVYELFKRDDVHAILARGDVRDLMRGPYVYIATAVVAPWAPRGTYRQLYRMVREANADAELVCGHMVKRDGRVIWHERPIKEAA